MRKIVSFLMLVLIASMSFAQQDPQFSLNQFNQLTVNPAFAGCNESVCASLQYRDQWMGFTNHPQTAVASIHGAFGKNENKNGLGIAMYKEGIGYESNFSLTFNYAFILKLGTTGRLSLGISAGLFNKSLDGDWLTPDMLEGTTSSPYVDVAVPYVSSKTAFDAGFGAFYRTESLYVGISSTHLPETRFNFGDESKSYLKRHYYLNAGYFWKTPNPLFEVRPGIFIKSDGVSAQYDIFASVYFRQQFWGGLAYRVGDAFIPMFGVQLPNNLKFAISYDVTTSDIGSYSAGSLEIFVGYCFNLAISPKTGSYKSVRFL